MFPVVSTSAPMPATLQIARVPHQKASSHGYMLTKLFCTPLDFHVSGHSILCLSQTLSFGPSHPLKHFITKRGFVCKTTTAFDQKMDTLVHLRFSTYSQPTLCFVCRVNLTFSLCGRRLERSLNINSGVFSANITANDCLARCHLQVISIPDPKLKCQTPTTGYRYDF